MAAGPLLWSSTDAGAAVATFRVSVAAGGAQASGERSFRPPSLSADGRMVAFHSLSANLVPGDTNEFEDVFVHDRQALTTSRVSVSSSGAEGGAQSTFPEISADGKVVAFLSGAANLVPGDTNGLPVSATSPGAVVGRDAFVRNLASGVTTRVSVGPAGLQGDCPADAPAPVDPPNRRPCPNGATNVDTPAISGDGNLVAFAANATTLLGPCTIVSPTVTCPDSNGQTDIFVRNVGAGTTTRASVASGGTQATGGASVEPSISTDGAAVAFRSAATNLVTGDTNAAPDIFVNRAGVTTRVSVSFNGDQATVPAGTAIALASTNPEISDDGCYVAFRSTATNLVPGDTNNRDDIFVRGPICPAAAATPATTARVSVPTGGGQADGNSFNPSMSADGRFVAYESESTNLIAGDTNNSSDVFVYDRQLGTTVRASAANGGAQPAGGSFFSALSADGGLVGFSSNAANLVTGDTNRAPDVFVVQRQAAQIAPGGIPGESAAAGTGTTGGSGTAAGTTSGTGAAASTAATPAATTAVASSARGSTVRTSRSGGLASTGGLSILLMATGGALVVAGAVLYTAAGRRERRLSTA